MCVCVCVCVCVSGSAIMVLLKSETLIHFIQANGIMSNSAISYMKHILGTSPKRDATWFARTFSEREEPNFGHEARVVASFPGLRTAFVACSTKSVEGLEYFIT